MQAGSLRGVMEQLERSGNKATRASPRTAHRPPSPVPSHGKQDMPLAVGTNSHVMLRSVPLPAGGRIRRGEHRRTRRQFPHPVRAARHAQVGPSTARKCRRVGWWIGPLSAAQTERRPEGLLCFTNPGDALRGWLSMIGFCGLP